MKNEVSNIQANYINEDETKNFLRIKQLTQNWEMFENHNYFCCLRSLRHTFAFNMINLLGYLLSVLKECCMLFWKIIMFDDDFNMTISSEWRYWINSKKQLENLIRTFEIFVQKIFHLKTHRKSIKLLNKIYDFIHCELLFFPFSLKSQENILDCFSSKQHHTNSFNFYNAKSGKKEMVVKENFCIILFLWYFKILI